MRSRRFVVGAVVAIHLLVWFVGGLLLPGGIFGWPLGEFLGETEPDVSVSELSVERVELNDEFAGDLGSADDDGVSSCVATGPPPDQFVLEVAATVEGPADEDRFRFDVRIGEASATTGTLQTSGPDRLRGIVHLEDRDTVDPGDSVDVELSLRRAGRTLRTVTRTATVEGRDQQCTSAGDTSTE